MEATQRTSWRDIARELAERLRLNEQCPEGHRPPQPDTCPFCADEAAVRRFDEAMSPASAGRQKVNAADAFRPPGQLIRPAGAVNLRSYLDEIERSPHANHCVECGHVRHNDLGYCQTLSCSCPSGVTYANLAVIIRRDLPCWIADTAPPRPEIDRDGLARVLNRVLFSYDQNPRYGVSEAVDAVIAFLGGDEQ